MEYCYEENSRAVFHTYSTLCSLCQFAIRHVVQEEVQDVVQLTLLQLDLSAHCLNRNRAFQLFLEDLISVEAMRKTGCFTHDIAPWRALLASHYSELRVPLSVEYNMPLISVM
jgi:hypothetical protein